MNWFTRKSLILSVFFVTQASARLASAQSDISGASPNVLLLVDTSGSMEYMTSSTNQPNCDPTGNTPSDKSRWVNLVEVLTGSINNYRCVAVDRSSTPFVNEYSLGGNRPADFGYSIPYHRPMSGNCIAGPGTIDFTNNAFAVSDSTNSGRTRVGCHVYNSATSNTCTFSQNVSDGLLSTYSSNVRFGLMTFDTKTNPGTGYNGQAANFPDGIAGTWSYFVGNYSQGHPGNCIALQPEEVGARNAAAPPWEGRMVAFGDPSPNSNDANDNPTVRAQWISEILLTTRPFDATPIAGMLDDARAFLWKDQTKDPLEPTSGKDFGPYNDPYVLGGCRKNFIILLTDGEPNLELRPDCEIQGSPNGVCPYQHTYEITRDLYNQVGSKQVQTFVIGFAVSQITLNGQPLDCRTLTATDVDSTNPGSLCSVNSSNAALRACCVLDQIAYNGGTNHAYFADNTTELSTALSSILSSVSKNTTSRTWPVMATVAGSLTGNGGAAAYRFYTSFLPRLDLTNAGLWSGVIERNRFVCTTPAGGGAPTAVLQPVDSSAGDEFANNVNSGNGPQKRKFYSFIGSVEGGKILSTGMLRPNLTTDDGAGVHTGKQVSDALAGFLGDVPAAAMNITDATCATDTPPRAAGDCENTRLGWLLGNAVINGTTTFSRCAQSGSTNCSLIADVYHSTPVIVNRPTDAPRDETYQAFATAWQQRPLMLYTSTNDGLLHAFKVASNYAGSDPLPVTTLANNELWAYLPPAVLPDIVSEFPGTHLQLLDGAPVVANIVATPIAGAAYFDGNPKYAFERTSNAFATATTTDVTATTWRTALVQGFGKNRGGYFALDITNPDTATGSPYSATSATSGPEFLWQLTEDSSNRWLFGPSGATPLITTLFCQPPSGDTTPREIPVAILPGGYAPADSSGTVTRANTSPTGIPSGYAVRTSIPSYTSTDAIAARSLTIVRLDTGEIVRTFRRSKTEGNIPASIQNRVIVTPLDSPITGQPVAYPAIVGSIADRVYVGDRDGGLWRVDLSSSNPDNWSMKLFFDAYAGRQPTDGQPIVMPPQLSINDSGQVTIAFSTGSQDDFSANNAMLNYVWSLTEAVNWTDPSVGTVGATVNWYRMFNGGERVVGPMQLFGGGLYFATYQPAAANAACNSGSSRIWGMNYDVMVDPVLDKNNPPVAPSDPPNPVSVGGRPWLPEGGISTATTRVQFLDNTSALLAGATVFGVAVAQTPSCVDNSTPTDAFFGAGLVHTTLPNITPASYQLVIQTGASGQSSVSGAVTNVTTIQLPTPDNSPRIASWATIME